MGQSRTSLCLRFSRIKRPSLRVMGHFYTSDFYWEANTLMVDSKKVYNLWPSDSPHKVWVEFSPKKRRQQWDNLVRHK
jgi:hypothetical protein